MVRIRQNLTRARCRRRRPPLLNKPEDPTRSVSPPRPAAAAGSAPPALPRCPQSPSTATKTDMCAAQGQGRHTGGRAHTAYVQAHDRLNLLQKGKDEVVKVNGAAGDGERAWTRCRKSARLPALGLLVSVCVKQQQQPPRPCPPLPRRTRTGGQVPCLKLPPVGRHDGAKARKHLLLLHGHGVLEVALERALEPVPQVQPGGAQLRGAATVGASQERWAWGTKGRKRGWTSRHVSAAMRRHSTTTLSGWW